MVDLFGAPIEDETDEDDIVNDSEIAELDDTLIPQELTPQTNSELTGHELTEERLLQLANSSKLPHALLITGPKGIGKSTLSYRLARYLLANESEKESGTLRISSEKPIFRKIATGAHPDFWAVRPEFDEKRGATKNSLSIQQIREIPPFLRKTTSQKNGYRIAIVESADTMTNEAQNSLLKILEEPPSNSVLIIVAETKGSLLPTIISRVMHIPLTPLSHEDTIAVIKNVNPEIARNEDINMLAEMSQGSAGLALNMAETNILDIIKELIALFEKWPSFDTKHVHILIEKMSVYKSGDRDIFVDFTESLCWILRSGIIAKGRGKLDDLPQILEGKQGYKKFIQAHSMDKLTAIYDEVEELLKRTIRQSLDKKNTLTQVFFVLQTRPV